jgi:hypothetical protein
VSREKSKKVKIFSGQFKGRIQAVSGQFGCPDFLYHEGRKKEAHTMYERLLACGYPAEMAREIIARTDPAELERYVRMIELLYDDRREYV